jgi:Fe-S-cluster containining protein
MKIETDIRRIEELTRHKEGEERRYRHLLGRCGLTTEEVDAIVQRHYRAVSKQVECQECGNCCRVLRPTLQTEDIDRLARCLRIPRSEFISEYLVEYGEQRFFRLTPCPFLANNACTVYPDRPKVCRSYPNLQKKGFVLDAGLAFSSCSVCPLVYNVYELVKRQICGGRVTTLSSEERTAEPLDATSDSVSQASPSSRG